MITKRKAKVPIFNYGLHIIVFDKYSELKDYLSEEELAIPSRGVTIPNISFSTVIIKSGDLATANHEALHVTNLIWRYIGYNPQRDNDEVSAYLSTYIFNILARALKMHVSNVL